ncbi:MAG: guanylate kinase [Dehalococcoidia bacterium]
MVRAPIEAIGESLDISFEPDIDDLGAIRRGVTFDERLGLIAFVWRHELAHLGVEVDVDMAVSSVDAIDWLKLHLGLVDSDFTWREEREHDLRCAEQRSPLVLIIHGPAGTGKDALADRLIASGAFQKAVSTTSRPPRKNEREGLHYYFVDGDAAFQAKIDEGAFIEWAWVHGQGKGLYRAEAHRLLASGDDFVIKTDVNGARHWRNALIGAIDILVLPAEPDDGIDYHLAILEARIREREPLIQPADLAQRLADARAEIEDAPNADYVVVNRNGALEEAERALAAIVERERHNPRRPRPELRA